MHAAHIILVALIWAYSPSGISNPLCPDYVPPTNIESLKSKTLNSVKYYTASSYCSAYLLANSSYFKEPVSSSDNIGVNSFQCYLTIKSSGLTDTKTFTWDRNCPTGYNNLNSTTLLCSLYDPNIAPCPPCATGVYKGNGQLTPYNGQPLCFGGCKIDIKGVGAGLGDAMGGDWYSTGTSCTDPNPIGTLNTSNPPSTPQSIKYNCVESTGKKLCFDRQKPGCGTLNGKEFCADKILNSPGVGRCIFVGSSGYVCGNTPPTIAGEPIPTQDFKTSIPIQDSTGSPVNAGSSTTFGSPGPLNLPTYAPGTNSPGIAGFYPGPSGNGTGQNDVPSNTPGGDGEAIKVDTDGDGLPDGDGQASEPSQNSCQTHPQSIGCQTEGTYWSKFAENIKSGITQTLGTPSDPDNLDTHNVTYSQNPSVPQDASCPANASINIAGQVIAFPYDYICTLALGVRPVVLAVASLLALYILIGANRMSSE